MDRLERRLHQLLVKSFSFEELKSLASMDLGLNYDELPREGISNFARELIGLCQRRGMLGRLEQLARGIPR